MSNCLGLYFMPAAPLGAEGILHSGLFVREWVCESVCPKNFVNTVSQQVPQLWQRDRLGPMTSNGRPNSSVHFLTSTFPFNHCTSPMTEAGKRFLCERRYSDCCWAVSELERLTWLRRFTAAHDQFLIWSLMLFMDTYTGQRRRPWN